MDRDRWRWWVRQRLLKPWRLLGDARRWILVRTTRRFHIVKMRSLRPGYYDVDARMLHACFQLLTDYVEKEKPFEFVDWDWDERHRFAGAEIKALYAWWKKALATKLRDDWDYPGDLTPLQHLELDEAFERECEENLIRLMKIRGYLWT